MDNLISRQATIDTLDKHLRTTDVPVSYPGIISALTEWLNELPSAQADSKELSGTHKALDTVSRQAVIEAINKIFPVDPMRNDYTQGITCGAALATEYIKQLPSAQPDIEKICTRIKAEAIKRNVEYMKHGDRYMLGFVDGMRLARRIVDGTIDDPVYFTLSGE